MNTGIAFFDRYDTVVVEEDLQCFKDRRFANVVASLKVSGHQISTHFLYVWQNFLLHLDPYVFPFDETAQLNCLLFYQAGEYFY